MNQILLKNDFGESVVASVIRYFKYNNELYMLYTLNEIDAANYIKLYGIKLQTDMQGNVTGTIIEDFAWSNISALVKEMVKPATERTNADFQDVNPNSISNINLVSKRVFKINKDMADLLATNIDIQNDENSTSIVNDNQNVNIATNESIQGQQVVQYGMQDSVDYRQLYEQELRNTEQMNKEIQSLRTKINAIENILKG